MIKKKLGKQRGTTLVELLAAVAVMILFSLMINTGLNMALKSYHTMISESETQLLLSTAADSVANELRYARDVVTEDGIVRDYTSDTFGYYTSIAVDDNGQLTVEVAGLPQPFLANGVYGEGGRYQVALEDGAGNEGIAFDKATSVFTFRIKILEAGETKAEEDFKIRSLNITEDPAG